MRHTKLAPLFCVILAIGLIAGCESSEQKATNDRQQLQINDLTKQRDDLKAKGGAAQAQVDALTKQLADQTDKTNNAQKELDEAAAQIKAQGDAANINAVKFDIAQKKVEDLTAKLADSQQALEEAKKQLAQAQADAANAKTSQAAIADKIERLDQENQQLRKKLDASVPAQPATKPATQMP